MATKNGDTDDLPQSVSLSEEVLQEALNNMEPLDTWDDGFRAAMGLD